MYIRNCVGTFFVQSVALSRTNTSLVALSRTQTLSLRLSLARARTRTFSPCLFCCHCLSLLLSLSRFLHRAFSLIFSLFLLLLRALFFPFFGALPQCAFYRSLLFALSLTRSFTLCRSRSVPVRMSVSMLCLCCVCVYVMSMSMFMSVCIVVAGKDLHGMKYEPLFDYFVELKGETAFRVLMDEYVTADGGVGIVHQAPGLYVCTYVRVCVRPSICPSVLACA